MISCRGLRLHRGQLEVLRGIELEVRPGQIIGLIGRNGAGKSTLIETLLGFHQPGAGKVELWGTAARSLRSPLKQRIALVSQRDELMEGLTGQQQIALIAAFYPRWDGALVARLTESWELPLSRPIRSYSLGQRQRLAIVLALASRPQLLVLDEPVASLDPLARAQFLTEMRSLIADPERAVIISSHIVSDLEALVNWVWLLDQGQLKWSGPIDQIGTLMPDGDQSASLERVFSQVVR